MPRPKNTEQVSIAKRKASFLEPMLLLRKETLPHDENLWRYEIFLLI
jgi:hypothetical protein